MIVIFYLLNLALVWVELVTAPEGFEDEQGFHYLRRQSNFLKRLRIHRD